MDRNDGIKVIRAMLLTLAEPPDNPDEKAGEVWDKMGEAKQEQLATAYGDFIAVLTAPVEAPKPEPATLVTVKGDATEPKGEGLKFIVHCCNDVGAWGAGFVLALSKKWPSTKSQFERWYVMTKTDDASGAFGLGQVQFVPVSDDIVVCNLIGQRGTGMSNGSPPIRYKAIEAGLAVIRKKIEAVHEQAKDVPISVHCPKFGAGLAGGDWAKIEVLVKQELVAQGIPVTVYEFAG